MKKRILCVFCTAMMILSSFTSALASDPWESPRYVQDDVKNGYPKTEAGNPYVTYYAPWLRQLHLMTATEAENNKTAGIAGGEACQQIRQLAISPVNPKIMYFCSDTSGVYKTTDGGKHWYSTTNNAAGHDAKGLLCDNKDEKIVYVNMRKVGVHRSKDGGYTWQQIVADTDKTQDGGKRSDTIVQDNDGNTYMAVGSGIYKLDRNDNLTNLTAKDFPKLAALTGNNGAEFLDIAVSPNGKYIYACCTLTKSGTGVDTGLYVSEDYGANWEVRNANPDGSQSYSNIRTLAIDPADSSYQTIYAGLRITETGASTAGDYNLYKSEDGGKTYTKVFRPQNLSKDNIYFYGLKFGPKNVSGLYPLYLHLEKTVWPLRVSYDYTSDSPDFSRVYTKDHKMDADTIRSGYSGYLYQAFQPDMSKEGSNDVRVIYAASGIYEYTGTYNPDTKTCDFKSVKRISSGYSGASATDIAFDSQGKMFMTVTDVGTYVNDGSAYTSASYPTFTKGDGTKYGVRAIFDPNDPDHVIMYVGSTNGHGTYCGIKQSSNGGKNFAAFNEDAKLLYSKPAEDTDDDSGEDNTEEDLGNTGGESTDSDSSTGTSYQWASYGNARVLCYDNEDVDKNGKKSTIYSSYHNSYDNGKTWEKNEYFLLAVHPDNTKLQAAMSGSGTSTVIYKTTDGGKTWKEAAKPRYSGFTDVDFDLNNPDYLWITRNVSGGKEAFVRVNLADGTVKDYTSKFTYKAFRKVEINPKNPNHMLVTSYPGRIAGNMKADFKLAESYDGGETWHTVTGLWGGDFNNIIFSPTTDEVFITGLAGTFIYDYEKFNYYQNMEFRYDGQSIFKELPRVNENGENVNNGSFIIAPEDLFKPANKRFTGWNINGEIYMPGDKVSIPD